VPASSFHKTIPRGLPGQPAFLWYSPLAILTGSQKELGVRLATKRKRVLKSPEDRRQEILDAAVRVFSDRGVSKSTVADIATAAGVAKGTVYLYFGSKEQLLGALRDRFVDALLGHVADLLAQAGQADL